MNRTVKIFFALGAGLFTGLLVMICILQILGFVYSNDIVMESCQGDYIKYNSYDPYCVYIIKQSQPLSSDYIIMISHKGSHTYGHVLNYIDTDPVSEEEIKKTRVIWSEQGIELTFPAGHKLYVPKDKFIGGR
jgi:hypothetical protein